jgi:hypothetical protein
MFGRRRILGTSTLSRAAAATATAVHAPIAACVLLLARSHERARAARWLLASRVCGRSIYMYLGTMAEQRRRCECVAQRRSDSVRTRVGCAIGMCVLVNALLYLVYALRE